MKRVYIGPSIVTDELNLISFGIYEGEEKLKSILEKYPVLSKLLIEIDDLPKMKNEKIKIEAYFKELQKQVKEGSNGSI